MSPAPISDELHEKLFEAYFTETLKADTSARENAERAFAVASAVAAVLIAAGAAIKIGERPLETKILGLAALAAWIGAAYAFMRAVGHATFPIGPADVGTDQWGNTAIDQALVMRRDVYNKLRRARQLSAAAGILTIIALTIAVLGPPGKDNAAEIGLSQNGVAALRRLCPHANILKGNVQLHTLEREYVTVKVPAPLCGNTAQTLRIKRRDVIALKND